MSSFNTGVIINKGPIVLRQKAYSHNDKNCMDGCSRHQFKEINMYPCNSWPLPICGLYQQLAFTNKWSLPTGSLYQPVVFTNSWLLPTGGLYKQVVFINSWPLPTTGLYQQMVFIHKSVCLYLRVSFGGRLKYVDIKVLSDHSVPLF